MARINGQRTGNELHPVYDRYRSMLDRCNNPNHVSYKNYGGRGITVAEDLKPFSNFRDYVTTLPNYSDSDAEARLITLDRINPNKNYEKGNLRWVSQSVQVANQRFSGKGSNKYTGVNWSKTHNRWIARVNFNGKCVFTKVCLTEKDAYLARVNYIKQHNLPFYIQPWVD